MDRRLVIVMSSRGRVCVEVSNGYLYKLYGQIEGRELDLVTIGVIHEFEFIREIIKLWGINISDFEYQGLDTWAILTNYLTKKGKDCLAKN